MKRRSFIVLFVFVHLLFIAFQIDKQGRVVKLSYEKQRLEKEKEKLLGEKQALTNQLYALQNRIEIKEYALKKGMQSVKLTQIKRLN